MTSLKDSVLPNIKFPTTNGELVNSVYEGNSAFFMTASVEKLGEKTILNFKPDSPLLVNDVTIGGIRISGKDLQDHIQQNQDKELLLRNDFSNGRIPENSPYNGLYTFATGIQLTFKDPGFGGASNVAFHVVKQNSPDKPMSANMFNFTSSSLFNGGNPLSFAAKSLKQEMALLGVTYSSFVDKPSVEFLYKIELPSIFNSTNEPNQEQIFDKFRKFDQNKHYELPENLMEIGVSTYFNKNASNSSKNITIKWPNHDPVEVNAHFVVDNLKRSANLHHSLVTSYAQPSDTCVWSRIGLDMQGFGSTYHLLTQDAIKKTLDKTTETEGFLPAPQDYFKRTLGL